MSFSENTLGIKIQEKFIAIEACDIFGDLSKYDFIYTDFVTSDWNGNMCYGSKITNPDDDTNYFMINRWKLLDLSFPGNWFGNRTIFELEDRFGKRIKIDSQVTTAVYSDSYKHMIREALLKIIKFTNEYPCVEYKEIIDGLKPVHGDLTIEKFHKLVSSVDEYVEKYLSLQKKLTKDEQLKFSSKLKEAVSKNISKTFGLSIVV